MTCKAPLLGGALIAMMVGSAAPALPAWPHQRAELFATCAGRLAALASHQGARHLPDAAATRAHSESFDGLLDATLPDALDAGVPETQPQSWWSSGWTEIAYLLAEEQYSFDAGRAQRARAARLSRIDQCEDALL